MASPVSAVLGADVGTVLGPDLEADLGADRSGKLRSKALQRFFGFFKKPCRNAKSELEMKSSVCGSCGSQGVLATGDGTTNCDG